MKEFTNRQKDILNAIVLGFQDDTIWEFFEKGLASTIRNLPVDEMVSLVMECGKVAVETMALLDKANTSPYGTPEITEVNLGVGKNPGILISGHDLKDMEELLIQTENSGVDVYTHGEMLPANYYPAFKKYRHFVGNYGGAWWQQNTDFERYPSRADDSGIYFTKCFKSIGREIRH